MFDRVNKIMLIDKLHIYLEFRHFILVKHKKLKLEGSSFTYLWNKHAKFHIFWISPLSGTSIQKWQPLRRPPGICTGLGWRRSTTNAYRNIQDDPKFCTHLTIKKKNCSDLKLKTSGIYIHSPRIPLKIGYGDLR